VARRFPHAEAQAIAEKHPDTGALSGADAIEWVRKLLVARVYRSFQPVLPALLEEDDRRRSVIEQHLVTTPDGARVCTLTFRPRKAAAKLTALLDFTVYSGGELPVYEARRTASHGYAGVEGFTRGKACSPDAPIPIEHDGTDAAAVIEWIARKPAMGRGEASAEGAEGADAVGHVRAGDRLSDGRQRVHDLRLSVAVLHDEQQAARRRDVRRQRALESHAAGVVRQRPRLAISPPSTARRTRSSRAGSRTRPTTRTGSG
jgi:hypothetical protein